MAEIEEHPGPIPTQDTPVAVFKKRGNKANIRKRPATPPPASDSDSGSGYSSEDESGRRVKRRKRGGIAAQPTALKTARTNNLEDTKIAASKDASIQITNDATKQSDWYEDSGKAALSTKNLLGSSRSKPESANDGSYKGTSNYQSFIQKNPNAPDRKVGPVKSSTNVRTITVTDFAPDVCKDYKQTGFCGFGDSCKFLHAREDYKQGWELDREWEVNTKGKKVAGKTFASANRSKEPQNEEEAEDQLLESIPFACIICKGPYKDPIVTKCGHYFCERCALTKYRKTPNCEACGEGTGGIFNTARNLRKLLERKRERAKQRKEKAREAGEDVSDSEEEA